MSRLPATLASGALLLAALLASGCGRTINEASETIEASNLALDQTLSPAAPPDLAPYRTPQMDAYRIGPGDRLDLLVPSSPETNVSGLLVRPDGKITLPLLGELEVAGLTPAEAGEKVSTQLERFIRRSSAFLTVTEARSARYMVLGAAARPGLYTLTSGPIKLLEALAEAGGVLEGVNAPAADLSRSYLLRDGKVVPVRLDRLLAGDMDQNIYLRGGDMLYLQPRVQGEVFVLGQVGGAAVVPADGTLTLLKALALAGGITKDAKDSAVRVIRGSLLEPKVYLTDFQDIVAGKARDVHLLPGDIVFVTTTELADWNYLLGQLVPTLQAALSTRYLIEGPNGLLFNSSGK